MTVDDLARLQYYDDLTARVWNDQRATPLVRELLLALAWITERDPAYRDPERTRRERTRHVWQQARRMLGHDALGRARYKEAIAQDAPRYEPTDTWANAVCEAPRVRSRIAAVCGRRASLQHHVVERDLRTGWQVDHWFCSRHRDHAARVRAQVRAAGEPPEPLPNTGGLLPCYFRADFASFYAKCRPGWTAPACGICADDWPTGPDAAELVPRKPRLRLITGELVDA